MSGYLGGLPEEGGPGDRAPAPGVPSPSVAAQLGIDYAELRARVNELGDQQQRVLDRQDEHDKDVQDLRARIGAFGDSLNKITESLERAPSGGQDSDPQPPSGWVHVPDAERAAWLVELQSWVRDVLFVQWPHTQRRLRWCWPLHMDIISDLWTLYRGYTTGFEAEDRRFADAETWRRSMDYLLKQAEGFTRDCPKYGEKPHPLPDPVGRDDTAVGSLVPVMSELVKAYDCLVEALEHLKAAEAPDTSEELRLEHRESAQQLRRRSAEITHAAGVTEEQWELFVTLKEGNQPQGQE
ncbi:hypothetical protein ACOQFV_24380 [Nocardiopsis changdeensis]|uniref:Poly(3-hydroxyalkanoate) polymerase subunit PhaE n=1 Tax=Nocardiopsis changdeensis TaxID=2831969 RepID=A0A975QAN8_9ACTN|nr:MULTISPECIES: hypothetical protein [Nocardiopsis]QUX26471.1 hypothetical protein KGD84_32755 [Nocardiopsis changdeensis]QYX40743.1 hypothetical protein K1J57_32605 [Nocardiopsis sp. MT53]